eukprot:6066117-Ditylum_brightwellii.AAC.1
MSANNNSNNAPPAEVSPIPPRRSVSTAAGPSSASGTVVSPPNVQALAHAPTQNATQSVQQ